MRTSKYREDAILLNKLGVTPATSAKYLNCATGTLYHQLNGISHFDFRKPALEEIFLAVKPTTRAFLAEKVKHYENVKDYLIDLLNQVAEEEQEDE